GKKSWQKFHTLIETYDNNMCKAWNDEIQNLLLFTGLFTAAVTAFVVESYQWLHTEPEDNTVKLLSQVVLLMANNTDLTGTLETASTETQKSPTYMIRINAFWFLSLTISLSTVLLGVLCLQWLREFQRDASMTSQDAIALRQLRHKGLIAWRVPEIISSLSLLLQVAVILFFAGIIDLVLHLNPVIAGCTIFIIGSTFLLLAITALAPTMQLIVLRIAKKPMGSQCPYKSSQAWIIYLGISKLYKKLSSTSLITIENVSSAWIDFDNYWQELEFLKVERTFGLPPEFQDNPSSNRNNILSQNGELAQQGVLSTRTHLCLGLNWAIATFGHRLD
ncbi:hypothetical protein AX16_007663, partial [Volvariella volvacea WC 439]